LIIAVVGDSFCSDMPFERSSESWQVKVAVDAAGLLAGLDHAGGVPAQSICPSRIRRPTGPRSFSGR